MTRRYVFLVKAECRDRLDYGVFGEYECTEETMLQILKNLFPTIT